MKKIDVTPTYDAQARIAAIIGQNALDKVPTEDRAQVKRAMLIMMESAARLSATSHRALGSLLKEFSDV